MRLLLLRSNDVWSVVLTILFIPRALWLFPSTGREFELKTSPHFSVIPRDTFSLSTLRWCPASFFYFILLLPFFLTDHVVYPGPVFLKQPCGGLSLVVSPCLDGWGSCPAGAACRGNDYPALGAGHDENFLPGLETIHLFLYFITLFFPKLEIMQRSS